MLQFWDCNNPDAGQSGNKAKFSRNYSGEGVGAGMPFTRFILLVTGDCTGLGAALRLLLVTGDWIGFGEMAGDAAVIGDWIGFGLTFLALRGVCAGPAADAPMLADGAEKRAMLKNAAKTTKTAIIFLFIFFSLSLQAYSGQIFSLKHTAWI